MNWPLFKKSLRDARWLLVGCVALIFLFCWLEVWLTTKVRMRDVRVLLGMIPPFLRRVSPVPIEDLATNAGRIAAGFDHPIVLLLSAIWGVGRGSDAVSGELGRGTLEMTLAQPVRRLHILTSQGAATVLGAILIASASWLGTAVGLYVSAKNIETPSPSRLFVPASLNFLALTLFLAGTTTAVSACGRYRGRTIGVVSGFYAVSLIITLVSRTVPDWGNLAYASFFSAYLPRPFVRDPELAWSWVHTAGEASWRYGGLSCNATLMGLGLVGYFAATLIFCRRDIPAPL